MYYQIRQCDAPCQGYISKEEYAKQIEETIKFLNGNYKQVAKMLQGKMQKASDELEFEQAMEYRDLLKSIERIMDRQKINTYAFEDRDILQWHRMIRMLLYLFSLSAKESFLEENIFIWKQMRKVQRKKF